MANSSFFRYLGKLGRWWDRHRHRFRGGRNTPVTIVSYRGYGSKEFVHISGRILRDKGIIRRETDRFWHNLMNNVKRFISNEINGAQVKIKFPNKEIVVTTDNEGYFKLHMPLVHGLSSKTTTSHWHSIPIEVCQIPGEDTRVKSTGEVLIPSERQLGIISDIDDTILKSDVTGLLKLKLLYLTLLKNAGSRIAFRQVSAFFAALEKGHEGAAQNPFFYVSNSPWNLYDLLVEFLAINELPPGPIFLRDFGLPYEDLPADHQGHKYETILKILHTYPEMSFVLIGDTGESDIDIYLSIANRFPDRIKAIYIRDVLSTRRAKRVASLINNRKGGDVKIFRSYEEAAADAAAKNLLRQTVFEKKKK